MSRYDLSLLFFRKTAKVTFMMCTIDFEFNIYLFWNLRLMFQYREVVRSVNRNDLKSDIIKTAHFLSLAVCTRRLRANLQAPKVSIWQPLGASKSMKFRSLLTLLTETPNASASPLLLQMNHMLRWEILAFHQTHSNIRPFFMGSFKKCDINACMEQVVWVIWRLFSPLGDAISFPILYSSSSTLLPCQLSQDGDLRNVQCIPLMTGMLHRTHHTCNYIQLSLIDSCCNAADEQFHSYRYYYITFL